MVKTHIEPCTKEEIDSIIAASADNEFYYVLFVIAKTTGRRLGEYVKLRVRDFDPINKTLATQVLKRRTYVIREAVLNDACVNLLQIFIARHKLKQDDLLFGRVSPRSIQYAIVRYAKRAGITHKVCFHNFRHYFVTHLLKKGWSYNQVSKFTGHGNPGTLVYYDHSVPEDFKDQFIAATRDI